MNDDLDKLMRVMECAFDPVWGEAWTRRQVADSLALPSTHYDLIGLDGSSPSFADDAAGFTLVRAAPGEEELLLIGVDPAHRRRGLGSLLLKRLFAAARIRGAERMYLEMRSNNPAITLYQAEGFEPIGRRPDYYRTADNGRIDAITFAKTL
jgi:ribosomal-protein-alanine N-acetyltransferase